MSTRLESLRCPHCGGAAVRQAAAVRCATCHALLTITVTSEAAAASTAAPPAHAAQTADWPAIVRRLAAESDAPASLRDAASVDGRYAWKLLLALRADCVVADIDCGLAGAAANLAPHAARIVAIDTDRTQLALARQRLAHAGPHDNVTLIQADARAASPLADGCVDCLVLGAGRPAGHLGGHRLDDRLNELRRVLRPGGELLFVGVNELSIEAALRGLGRLPGPLRRAVGALRLLWRRLRAGLGRLPNSAGGYRRTLARGGFERIECYALGQAATFLASITPLDRPAPDGWQTPRRKLLETWNPRGVGMSPQLACVARRSGAGGRALYRRVLDEVGRSLGATARIRSLRIGRKEKIVALLDAGEVGAILRVPLNRAARRADRANHDALLGLRQTGTLAGRVPQALLDGEVEGLCYFVESRLPGVALSALLRTRPRGAFLAQIARLLSELSTPRRERLEGELYEQLVSRRIGRIAPLVAQQQQLRALEAWFRDCLYGAEVSLGTTHGDFGVSNVLVEGERIVGLIDWETSSDRDLPILDAISYLDSVHRLYNGGDRPSQIIPRLAADASPIEAEREFLWAQYDRHGIDPRHHAGLVHLKWLRHIDHLADFWLPYDAAAIRSYVGGVVDELTA